MANSLADLFVEHGIRMKRLTAGLQTHVICPRCEGGRTREEALSVKIDPDGAGAMWNCKRGSCGWSGGGKVVNAVRSNLPEPERVAQRPPPHTPQAESHRPPWLFEAFAERNIGAHTVTQLGIYAASRRFPDPVGECDAIVFPYRFKREVVNRKYRPHPAKNPMLQERNALATLYNVDALGEEPEDVIFVEGEMDVAALVECGLPHTVSLKDGAPAKFTGENDKRLEGLRTHADVLGKAKRFILAGDMDEPGLALREELALRLGRNRCWLVDWPDGCKDACDVLRRPDGGVEAVLKAISEARRYPLKGVQRANAQTLVGLVDRPPAAVMSIGLPVVDEVVQFPADGRLILITGWPSGGKTSFTRFLLVETARRYNRKWAVFSPEMQPWDHFIGQCAEVLVGKPLRAEGRFPGMSRSEMERAGAWLGEHVLMLTADSDDVPSTLDWILEMAKGLVLSEGITDLLIDPWNEVDHDRGAMSETDYIGNGLQKLKKFGRTHQVNPWVIAHPAKPPQLRPGEKRGVPGPYDIASSAHWANKTDLGLTVHQPEGLANGADLHVWKSRLRSWGIKNTKAPMIFEPITGRYSSAASEEPDLI